MKKLNLEQMEKVSGGDQCQRLKDRHARATKKNKSTRMVKLSIKHEKVCGKLL